MDDTLDDEIERIQRIRASVSRIINNVREYTSEDGSSVDATSPNIIAEAANIGQELHDTIDRANQNASLLDFTTQRPENDSIHEKYLNVLRRAEEKTCESGSQIVYLNYRDVATPYGPSRSTTSLDSRSAVPLCFSLGKWYHITRFRE